MGKVLRKGLLFEESVAHFIPHMALVDEHRESLLRLQGVWDTLALMGQMSGSATDMAGTRSAFHALTGSLLDSLARRLMDNTLHRMRGKAQVAIDILVRNLFERTADIGFLAADDPLREHVLLCMRGDAEGVAHSREALEARFHAYVAKYSVYDDVVVLSPQGDVLARLNRAVAGTTPCKDSLIAEALRPEAGYVEHFGSTELLGQRTGLIYASAIKLPDGPGGVLCLSFKLADEMRAVFQQLLPDEDRTVLALCDANGQVVLSSDRWQIPPGAELVLRADQQRLVFAGRDYLVVKATASGYEGYMGPGWSAWALLPVEHAFATDEAAADGAPSFSALAASLDTSDLFDAELRGIPVQAANIQSDLSRSLWNAKLRSRKRSEGADFAATLLNEVQRTGQQLREVFEQAICSLQDSALAAVFDAVRFHARLGIDIMDRNLYERANDVRWWALNSSLQCALQSAAQGDIASAQEQAGAVLQSINGLYTVYSLLLVFDTKGQVIAVSDPAQAAAQIGHQLKQSWVSEALALRDRERFVVSRHEPSELYGGAAAQQRATYVYASALPDPADGNRVVGGIAIVFDGEPQFAAMLRDALPPSSAPGLQASGLFVTRSGRVLASTAAERWPVGSQAPIALSLLQLAAGQARHAELEIDGVVHAAGLALSGGYREYRHAAEATDEDVLALVLQPLGAKLASTNTVQTAYAPPLPVQTHSPDDSRLDIASFRVAGQNFGLPAEQIIEALERPRMTALPNATQSLVGMVDHQDGMLPVVDLGMLMDSPSTAADTAMLVCQTRHGQRMALRVQALGLVFSISNSQAQPSPTRVGWTGQPRLVRNSLSGDMLTLLDADMIWAKVSGVSSGVTNEWAYAGNETLLR